MPGYSVSRPVEGIQEIFSADSFNYGLQSLASSTLNGKAGCSADRDISATERQPNDVSDIELLRRSGTGANHVFDVLWEGSTRVGTNACLDRNSELVLQCEVFLNGKFSPALERRIDDAVSNVQHILLNCGAYSCSARGVCETKLEGLQNKAREGVATIFDTDKLKQDSSTGEAHDIRMMSSVQSWAHSLSPDMEYENEFSSNCSEKCVVGCEKHCVLQDRSPLHRHFGYKSPLELLERTVVWEDEEMRIRTVSASIGSSASSPNTARQFADAVSSDAQVSLTPGRSKGVCDLDNSSTNRKGRDVHWPLFRLLNRSWKKGRDLRLRPKAMVVVNGHALSSAAVKEAEQRAGKLWPGSYWYDCTAGFWGVGGGPCRGILPPSIKQFFHPMLGNCANGDTQVYVNGRELNSRDLAVLSRRGFPQKAGKAYSLNNDGLLVDQTTGIEIKHLGKLAPTVERRRKGFGMFAGNVPEITQPVVRRKFI